MFSHRWQNPHTPAPMFASLLTTLFFSFSAIFGRQVSRHLPGTMANLSRLILCSILFGIWSHLFGFGISGKAFPILFLSGCVGFGVGDLALFQTYPRLGSRRSMVMVQCLAAPLGALMEWLWLGHAPTFGQAVCGAAILAGVGVALMPGKGEDQPTHGLTAGIFFGFLAAVGQAGGAVLSRKAFKVAADAGEAFHGVGDGVNAAYQRMLGGLLVSAIFFVWLKLAHKPLDGGRKADWPKAWPWLIGNSLAGPCFGVACYQWALMSSPTNIVLPIVATTPLAVIPLAHFFEKERVTKRAIFGGVIAVAGVIGLTLLK
ncbi:MAG: DMT family transporter [Verrucomicrobiota bacterium]